MGFSEMPFTFSTMDGASCANLSSTRTTPSVVGMTATLPPFSNNTQMFSEAFSTRSAGRGCFCCCVQATQTPAIPIATTPARIHHSLRKTMGELYQSGSYNQNMRTLLRRVAVAALLFAATLPAEVKTLTILHTNDLHSRLTPLENKHGGFAYLASV